MGNAWHVLHDPERQKRHEQFGNNMKTKHFINVEGIEDERFTWPPQKEKNALQLQSSSPSPFVILALTKATATTCPVVQTKK